jgi:hypothetical protein
MDEGTSYLLLDAARMKSELMTAKELNPQFDSLYRGLFEEAIFFAGPYIFSGHNVPDFRTWYFEKGWGYSWGVLIYSAEDMKSLRKHFGKFIMVKTEQGDEFYFRFYDPRVLRVFLPTCDPEQLKELFDVVDYYLCEDEDPSMGILFSLENGFLKSEKLPKDQVITFEPVLKKKSGFLRMFKR